MLGVGVIGAGGIGERRAITASDCEQTQVVAVHDLDRSRAEAVAMRTGASVFADWQVVVRHPAISIVVVATTHDALARISVGALRAGKHVLCEKPMGRNPVEARRVVDAARQAGKCLKAGYNHRYHPAVRKVQQICISGKIGPVLHIRGRYGHGGRPGYEHEWRAVPQRSGGGELLDQGTHLVDLAAWLLGPFDQVLGHVCTSYWDMAVEDNAFGLFRTAAGQCAALHVSWTQWKNLFSLEVLGRDGYALAEGLGRSYGPERATVGYRSDRGGPPDETVYEFPGNDESWRLEWEDMLAAITGNHSPLATGEEALETMEWVYRLYAASIAGRSVSASETPWTSNQQKAPSG